MRKQFAVKEASVETAWWNYTRSDVPLVADNGEEWVKYQAFKSAFAAGFLEAKNTDAHESVVVFI